MKEEYQSPVIEIVRFSEEDAAYMITASCNPFYCSGYYDPNCPGYSG